jgi:hypothetical protein
MAKSKPGNKSRRSKGPAGRGRKNPKQARGKKRDNRKVDATDLLDSYWLKSGDEKAVKKVEESKKKEVEDKLASYWKKKGTGEEEKKEEEAK